VNEEDARLISIRNNAALAVSKFKPLSGFDFGFDKASVDWVDGFIERLRNEDGMNPAPEQFISLFGSYLGEAIIIAAGGCWAESEEGWLGILFPNEDWCFPFGKVEKQFEQGHDGGESIASYFDVTVNYVATGKLRALQSGNL
jgi:hypothetical protein